MELNECMPPQVGLISTGYHVLRLPEQEWAHGFTGDDGFYYEITNDRDGNQKWFSNKEEPDSLDHPIFHIVTEITLT